MAHVRNAWYVVGSVHDSVPDRPVSVQVLNEPIVMWRNAAGEFTAFEDRCIHRLAPLSMGRCEGEKLRCMYHGLLYDRSGQVVEIPGQDHVPGSMKVRTYPVTERHGWIWVWMGDSAADEGLLPPAIYVDQTNYTSGYSHLDFDAEAFLLSENLVDLSHAAFLHGADLPNSEVWVRELPKVTKHERSTATRYWIRGVPWGGSVEPERLVDNYYRMDFYVPGVLTVSGRDYPAGTADALNGEEPDLDRPPFNVSNQMVTPITDRLTRYFYTMAYRRDYNPADQDAILAQTAKVFADDKTMIEAQQKIIDATPGWRFTPTAHDRPLTLVNQIIDKLLRAEADSEGETAWPTHANEEAAF